MEEIKTRHIVLLVPSDTTLLTTVGPLEVFTKAVQLLDATPQKNDFRYQTHVVAIGRERLIQTSSGLSILSEGNYTEIDYPVDTLIVTGVARDLEAGEQAQLSDWLCVQSQSVRRICSVCSGAFTLAEAGLLDGKKATAHWSRNEELAETYPLIDVQIAQIFIKDGNIYTSAGVTSGMDLALALIEEDLDQSFALQVARWLVIYLKRPGNQAQYSIALDYRHIAHPLMRKACTWAARHLEEEITVEKLAEQVAMSPRNFARVFTREIRVTPARYINKLRVEKACELLIETSLSSDQIALYCGLKTTDNLRRQFLALLEVTPAQYRKSFQSSWQTA